MVICPFFQAAFILVNEKKKVFFYTHRPCGEIASISGGSQFFLLYHAGPPFSRIRDGTEHVFCIFYKPGTDRDLSRNFAHCDAA